MQFVSIVVISILCKFLNGSGREVFLPMTYLLKDKSGAGMVNATKETYHLLTQILTVVSLFELSNGCQV